MFDVKNEKASPGLEEYAQEFLEDRFMELEDMRKYYVNSDLENIRKLAHKWKGFCVPYGFIKLETLSESLEKAAIESNQQESLVYIDQINEYLKAKKIALKGV